MSSPETRVATYRGAIIEDTPTAQFFERAQTERARVFLSRVLHH